MSRKTAILGTLIVAAAVAGGGWLIAKKRASDLEAARLEASRPILAPTVSVQKTTTADFVETAVVSGSLVAREEILVNPEIEGLRVLELFAEEGDKVAKGQVLARLVSEQLDAQLAQNDAALARAAASIAQAKSQIVQAEAQAKEATAQLERAEPLKKSGYLSGSTYDQRESDARTTQSKVIAAREGLTAAEAEKTQVEAQRREITWKLGNTEVKAPEDGVVSHRNARIGAAATSIGEPMFKIIEKAEIELDAEIVETELPRVKVGQKAVISISGAGDVEGTVRLVAPEVDRTTRLGRVKIFLGTNPALRVGAFARGRIETGKSRGLAVSTASVTFDQSGPFVFIADGDLVRKRVLKTGLIAGDIVEVKEGLKEGDLIVTRAGTFLRDGDKIRPALPDAALSEAK